MAGYYVEGICRAHFSARHSRDVLNILKKEIPKYVKKHGKITNVAEAFETMGFKLIKKKDAYYITEFIGDKYSDYIKRILNSIAKFMVGFIQFLQEDGQWWMWKFSGGKMVQKDMRVYEDHETDIKTAHCKRIYQNIMEGTNPRREYQKADPELARLTQLGGNRKLSV
jgi:hypothetical protein